jgi:hypothetical protein
MAGQLLGRCASAAFQRFAQAVRRISCVSLNLQRASPPDIRAAQLEARAPGTEVSPVAETKARTARGTPAEA